jgi:glycosyltransferase involved in cell wall biosynthesis
MASAEIHPPTLSLLLMAYNQQDTIRQAIEGALSQDYTPLQIIISDDQSGDDTFAVIQQTVSAYHGPHEIIVNRNPANLGIGAHLSKLVSMSRGELLLVAAGDDISLPHRCTRTAQIWEQSGRKLDLIACSLADMDAAGQVHERITPSDLGTYRNIEDWLRQPPHVIGAGQAWTRRLFEHFGPLPAGVVAEDLLMVFRAISTGGACSTGEVLVRYRRGGISRKVRALHAHDVVLRLLKNSRHAVIEYRQFLADAARIGNLPHVKTWIEPRLQKEELIQTLFNQKPSIATRLTALRQADMVPWSTRLRLAIYSLCPQLLAPFFALKRLRYR